jgi:hypothetical protein
MAFSDDGRRLSVAYRDGTAAGASEFVVIYSVRSLRPLRIETPLQAAAGRGFWSARGDRFAIASPELTRTGTVALDRFTLSAADIQPVAQMIDAGRTLAAVRTDRSGNAAAIMTGDGQLFLWRREDPTTGLDLRSSGMLPMPVADQHGLRLSSDGSTLLLREPDGDLHIASLRRDQNLSVLPFMRPFPAAIHAVDAVPGPDGSQVYVALPGGAIELIRLEWSLFSADPPVAENGSVIGPATGVIDPGVIGTVTLSGHGAMVDRLSLSPDGAYLAAASLDGRLRIGMVDRARRVAALPLSGLPTGPASQAIPAEPLFDSPYALIDEPLVLKVQRALVAYGYSEVRPDGILGAVTLDAIRRFRETEGVEQQGAAIDRALYARMRAMGLFAGGGRASAS